MKVLLIVVISFFVTACSDEDQAPKAQQDHVWKTQTDALQKAKDVEKLLNDNMLKQQQEIDLLSQ